MDIANNMDQVMRTLGKLENPNEAITEARKNLRAVVRKYVPIFKSLTPIGKTGDAKRSVKVKSSSRRGVSTVRLVWGVPYIGIVNFKQGNKSEKFATMKFNSLKQQLELEGKKAVTEAYKTVFKRHGLKVK